MKITVENYKNDKYYDRVKNSIHKLLLTKNEISIINIFMEMSLLTEKNYFEWYKGNIPYLEKVINCNLSKINRILRIIGYYCHDLNLGQKYNSYKHNRKILKFSKTGDENIEKFYKIIYFIIGNYEKFKTKRL